MSEHIAVQAKHGMLPVHRSAFTAIQQSAVQWSIRLKQAVATCNGLTMIDKSLVAGHDLERALFRMMEARFLVSTYIKAYDELLPLDSRTLSSELLSETRCIVQHAFVDDDDKIVHFACLQILTQKNVKRYLKAVLVGCPFCHFHCAIISTVQARALSTGTLRKP